MGKSSVAVVGGGISGLSCAHVLSRRGFNVEVFEKERIAGGNARSELKNGYLIERGPNTFMGSATDILRLIESLEISASMIETDPHARRRFIVRNSILHEVPSSLSSFFTTSLLNPWEKFRLALEPFIPRGGRNGESAAEFFDRRFGKGASRVLAGAFISGVFAGDPDMLSAEASFPLFYGFEKNHGSMIFGAFHHRRKKRANLEGETQFIRKTGGGLYSMKNGLGQITERLFEILGERCHTSSQVQSIEIRKDRYIVCTSERSYEAEYLVMATPPHEAAALLGSISRSLADLLGSIVMAPVAVLYLTYPASAGRLDDGFGFLVPRNEGLRSLGVLYSSSLFSNRAPSGMELLTAFAGGMLDAKAVDLSDRELFDIATGDLGAITKKNLDLRLIEVKRYHGAIPQFKIGYLEMMKQIRFLVSKQKGLHLCGNYLKGVGMKDAVGSGFEAANAISGGL
ncbi:MAG: protoporphyrinogen oxidase [Oligoflexales bacterium]|nr:protoporphyrinogen oxidase [Oligoflexales bacterium]